MSSLVPRALFRRLVPGLPSTSRFIGSAQCVSRTLCNSQRRSLFSSTFCLSSAAQEKFDELIAKKYRIKSAIRKRRALSAAAQYNVERERLPQVVSICLSEAVDLHSILNDTVISNMFNIAFVDEEFENALHLVKKVEYTVNPTELSEIFIFEDGVVVFWNVEIQTRANLMRELENYLESPYESTIAHGEQDKMPFVYTHDRRSRIKSDSFLLCEEKHSDARGRHDGILERFALSHAFAASVKVGVWEALLNNLSEPLADTTKSLKQGVIPWSRKEALRSAGEFAALRHSININCQLMNKDFYWERADLEHYYEMTARHLTLERRLSVLNNRLDYCEELVRMVDNMLSLRHASTLEWMIIVLIVIEVFFDIWHFADSSPKPVYVVPAIESVTNGAHKELSPAKAD